MHMHDHGDTQFQNKTIWHSSIGCMEFPGCCNWRCRLALTSLTERLNQDRRNTRARSSQCRGGACAPAPDLRRDNWASPSACTRRRIVVIADAHKSHDAHPLTHLHAYIHTCIHAYIHHTCIHTYIHTYIHAYIHACIHARTPFLEGTSERVSMD
jgi:hypothetical protein